MSPEGFEPPTFRSLYYQAVATLSNQDVFIALIFYTAVTNMLTAVDESDRRLRLKLSQRFRLSV